MSEIHNRWGGNINKYNLMDFGIFEKGAPVLIQLYLTFLNFNLKYLSNTNMNPLNYKLKHSINGSCNRIVPLQGCLMKMP